MSLIQLDEASARSIHASVLAKLRW
jgi:hypothetical protein